MKKAMKLNVAKVTDCVLNPWPRQAVALRTAKTGDTIIGVDERGRLYSSDARSRCHLGISEHHGDVVSCLVKLRLLTDEHRADWKSWARQRRAESRRLWAAEGLLRNAASAGLRLTPKQVEHLRAITGEEPAATAEEGDG